VDTSAQAMTERRSRLVIVLDGAWRTVAGFTSIDRLSLYETGEQADAAASLVSDSIIIAPRNFTLAGQRGSRSNKRSARSCCHRPNPRQPSADGIISTSVILADVTEEGSVWQRDRT
jgi:hypothetical protein